MPTDPYPIIERLEKATSRQETEYLLDVLATLGEPAVIALLEKMPGLVTSHLHLVGAEFFAKVGYPTNTVALEFMVSDASNINSSTYELSAKALINIGAPVLPKVDSALEFYRSNAEEYLAEIDALEAIRLKIQGIS